MALGPGDQCLEPVGADEDLPLEELITASEASAEALPHRRRYLLLVDEYLRGLLDLQLELIEKV